MNNQKCPVASTLYCMYSAIENCCNNNTMLLNLLPATNQVRSNNDERQKSNNDNMRDKRAIMKI